MYCEIDHCDALSNVMAGGTLKWYCLFCSFVLYVENWASWLDWVITELWKFLFNE